MMPNSRYVMPQMPIRPKDLIKTMKSSSHLPIPILRPTRASRPSLRPLHEEKKGQCKMHKGQKVHTTSEIKPSLAQGGALLLAAAAAAAALLLHVGLNVRNDSIVCVLLLLLLLTAPCAAADCVFTLETGMRIKLRHWKPQQINESSTHENNQYSHHRSRSLGAPFWRCRGGGRPEVARHLSQSRGGALGKGALRAQCRGQAQEDGEQEGCLHCCLLLPIGVLSVCGAQVSAGSGLSHSQQLQLQPGDERRAAGGDEQGTSVQRVCHLCDCVLRVCIRVGLVNVKKWTVCTRPALEKCCCWVAVLTTWLCEQVQKLW